MSVPIMVGALVLALAVSGVIPERGDTILAWAIGAILTLVLTTVGLWLKSALLRAISPDWELRLAVIRYKRATLCTLVLWGAGALVPIAVYAYAGSLSYFAVATLIPLLVLAFNFPHSERFNVLVEAFFGASEPENPPEVELGP
jgi:hypothetical protein